MSKIIMLVFLIPVFCAAQQRQNLILDSLLKVMRDSGIATMVIGHVVDSKDFWKWADSVQPVMQEYIINPKKVRNKKSKKLRNGTPLN